MFWWNARDECGWCAGAGGANQLTKGRRDEAPHSVAEGEFGYRPPRAAEGASHAGGDGGEFALAFHQRESLLATVIVQVAVSLGNVTNNVHVVRHEDRHQPGGVALLV